MTPVIIRRAGPEHAADIRRLLAVQLAEHGIALGGEKLAAAIDGVIDAPRRGFFLVALRDGACIGVAYVSFIWALEHGGHAGWLEELYVRVRSLYDRHGFTGLPRSRVVKKLGLV